MFIFFHSRLEPTTLIKAQNASNLTLYIVKTSSSKNSQKIDSSYIQLPFHTSTCSEVLVACPQTLKKIATH
jgi:hypothetical protein